MTIFQPRIWDGGVSSETLTSIELYNWAEYYLKPRAELAYAGKGKFAPGEETCCFCRVKESCRARAEYNINLYFDAPETALLTPGEAGKMLQKAQDIKTWLEDLASFVFKGLFGGEEIEGWKLVEGRSIRKFADENRVVELMKSAGYAEELLYEKHLLTLTHMEDAFGKKEIYKILSDVIIKPPGKLTIAPVSDKRPAITSTDSITNMLMGE
jgi:hypothetical protein